MDLNCVDDEELYLKPFAEVNNPHHKFYLLYKNGVSHFEKFVNSLSQKQDLNDLGAIIASMDRVHGNNLPKSEYNHISGGKKPKAGRKVKKRDDIYEFKRGRLRVYCIKIDPDYYVAFAAYKKSQDKKTDDDIDKVNRLFIDLPEDIKIVDTLPVKEDYA